MSEFYALHLRKQNRLVRLSVTANDRSHGSAQACDIARALRANAYRLFYTQIEDSILSRLFTKLSTNDFESDKCFTWEGSSDKGKYPCTYLFDERYLIRDIILRYLDSPKESNRLKMICGEHLCINPHHFTFTRYGDRTIADGDRQMLLAYVSQGATAAQLAEHFGVSRSTIYRKLKNERLPTRTESNG